MCVCACVCVRVCVRVCVSVCMRVFFDFQPLTFIIIVVVVIIIIIIISKVNHKSAEKLLEMFLCLFHDYRQNR